MNSEAPNVLFIMDDQHSARCLGCYGNDDVQTPSIDQLANEGVKFDRAYCQNPICMPSRTSVFTGRYPHSLGGVYGNYGGLDGDVLSLAHHLNNHGYDTGAFGKLHLPVGWPTHGFDTRRSCDYADAEHHAEENDYYAYLKRVGLADDYDFGPPTNEYPFSTYVSNIPYEHCVEKWTADETIRWLQNREVSQPFFAWTTFQRPHPPYSPPPEYADLYSPADIELPPRDPGEFETKPAEWREQYESDSYQQSSDEDIKQVLAYYYGLITLIDDQIGRIREHLAETGELENTIVVFASDHGDFAGEHGFVSKNVGISEAIHRVPFVWRYPDSFQEGATNQDLVELVDIFPTLCDVLDVSIPDDVQGQSLESTLTIGDSVDRDAAYCIHAHLRTIRTDDWKLTYYVDENDGELYHIAEDPWEHENLYHREEYQEKRLELMTQLFRFHIETEEPVIPPSGIPEGTEAHETWSRTWWEEGGTENRTPLAHLDGAGRPLTTEETESDDT